MKIIGRFLDLKFVETWDEHFFLTYGNMMNISGKCIFTGMNSSAVLDLWILGNSGVAIKTVWVTVIGNKYKVRPSLINLILSRYN